MTVSARTSGLRRARVALAAAAAVAIMGMPRANASHTCVWYDLSGPVTASDEACSPVPSPFTQQFNVKQCGGVDDQEFCVGLDLHTP